MEIARGEVGLTNDRALAAKLGFAGGNRAVARVLAGALHLVGARERRIHRLGRLAQAREMLGQVGEPVGDEVDDDAFALQPAITPMSREVSTTRRWRSNRRDQMTVLAMPVLSSSVAKMTPLAGRGTGAPARCRHPLRLHPCVRGRRHSGHG